MARLLTFVLFAAYCLAAVAAKCNHICTQEYLPVCARNRNGELKTFSNKCEFNSVQCENPAVAWFILKDGVCMQTLATKCSQICSMEYNPVCGQNQNGEIKTFSNLCMFNSAQCENPAAGWFKLRSGACMEMKEAKCNHDCTDDYTPVCGKNRNGELRTFSNFCVLNIVQCEEPSVGWFRLRDGVCMETKSVKCNHACTDDFSPVCGKNRSGELKTFANLCMFNSVQCENPIAGWFRLRDGACMETKTAKCNQICTTEYNPVCGRNQNGEFKTFANLCMFNIVQCDKPAVGWFILKAGVCMETKTIKCNHACTDDYTPVCGRNRNGELKTFSNFCELNIAQCEEPSVGWFRLRDGACMGTKTAKCNHVCTDDFSPVCGKNRNGELKTFANLCMFNSVQCENPIAGWFRLRDGACMETKTAKCNQICTTEYNPVCGRNQNGEFKTFANLCMFNIVQCDNPTVGWFIPKAGVCMETKTIKCNHACTDDYTPVCGRNRNGELKTFSNFCELNIAQCEEPSVGWFRLRDGACMGTKTAKCNHVCTDDFSPVCGKNRNEELKTFANLCMFNSVQCENPIAGWFRLRDEACMENFSVNCNQICTAEYKPICGRNQNGELKTFGNLCMFNVAQCENPSVGWFRQRDGACE